MTPEQIEELKAECARWKADAEHLRAAISERERLLRAELKSVWKHLTLARHGGNDYPLDALEQRAEEHVAGIMQGKGATKEPGRGEAIMIKL